MEEEQIGCGVSLREAMPLGKETPLEVIQKIGETGFSGGISDVTFYPTFKCNLDCYMCLVKHMKDHDQSPLSSTQVKDAFKDAKTLFHLGGEPFIYDNTMEIMKYFDSKGINQIVSTNGTHVTPAIAEQLAAMENLVVVQVSLNGSGENDNNIRGSPTAFNKTVESIKNLKNAGVLVWIHCVILNENIDDLANVVKLGADLGVGAVNFIFAHVITQEEILATEKLVKSWLGEDVEVGGHVGELTYTEEQLKNSINAAKEVGKEKGIQVMFFSRLFGEQPELYYRGTLLEQENPICQLTLMPPLTPDVGPDGEVYNCPYLVKSFGNVKDTPLAEIWDSEPMRTLRKGMINGKLMPICRRCPCSDKIETSKPDTQQQGLVNKESWESYLEKLYKALNDLPEVPPILEKLECTPVVFQHHITDRPELNYWHAFEKDGIRWGMGENNDENVTKLIHKTDLETLKNINSGDENPVQATMAGKYSVDGDMTILMSCAPLLPLTVKAHALATK